MAANYFELNKELGAFLALLLIGVGNRRIFPEIKASLQITNAFCAHSGIPKGRHGDIQIQGAASGGAEHSLPKMCSSSKMGVAGLRP